MEYETDDANKNWLDRVKESPRTVSALIIILIVVAAIYAFSGNQDQNSPQEENQEVAQQEETSSPTPTTEGTEDKKTEEKQAGTAVTKENLQQNVESLPKAEKTDKGYQEVAQRGDGLTHLARRATSRYLAENTATYTITNEHRIYIEDYVRKNMQKKHVAIGQAEVIPFDVIAEAVESASHLSNAQLRNLTKYTYALK